MPRLGSIIALTLLALAVEVFAQRHSELEFAGIPFGVSRETVIEELMKMGYDTYDQGGHTQVPVFKFGDLPVQVDFIFNKNDKFYAFEIRTGRVEEARKGKAIEAVEYMSEQFTLKYGKPSADPAVQEHTLRAGRNIYQEWYGVKLLNAATSVIKQGEKFFAVGVVEHRTLAKEAVPQKKAKEKTSAEPVF
ncbi:MAG: hypothetical protein IKR75_03335 [Fibrobacter sp.]|nr:hypothetical protein [Fibrobacter sp.]MBR6317443.1 hypothetical protein [Fibrobacter sp.]